MRKIVLTLLALLAVPAFAAPVFTATDNGDLTFTLSYDANGTDLISGMGITLTADSGATIDSIVDEGSVYWVHPSNIQISGGSVTSQGTAVVSGLGTGTLVLEYGALYDKANASDPNKPAATGDLCTITVSAECKVTVTADHAGGVVTESLASYAPTAQVDVTGGPEPIPGDINGGGCVDFQDFLRLRASYGKALGDSGYNPDANIYNEGTSVDKVDFQDFLVLRANYGTGNCPE